jgi:hypothetical protein
MALLLQNLGKKIFKPGTKNREGIEEAY